MYMFLTLNIYKEISYNLIISSLLNIYGYWTLNIYYFYIIITLNKNTSIFQRHKFHSSYKIQKSRTFQYIVIHILQLKPGKCVH